MERTASTRRFDRAPKVSVLGVEVPLAVGIRARLLGLAGLQLEQAGAGLLIPRCSSVHTFGMRFELDLVFLDGRLRPLAVRRSLPPLRLAGRRGASAVLELPAGAWAREAAVAESGNLGVGGGEPALLPSE